MTCQNINNNEIRNFIEQSNRVSLNNRNRYVLNEDPCLEELYVYNGNNIWWLNGLSTFDIFFTHYCKMYLDMNQHASLRVHVYSEAKYTFKHRFRQAVIPLRMLRSEWSNILEILSGGCPRNSNWFESAPLVRELLREVAYLIGLDIDSNIGVYPSKILSLLFIDWIVPFDTASLSRLRKNDFNTKSFLHLQKELHDCVDEIFNNLNMDGMDKKISEIRSFDSLCNIHISEYQFLNRPIGRVLDKMFYMPGPEPLEINGTPDLVEVDILESITPLSGRGKNILYSVYSGGYNYYWGSVNLTVNENTIKTILSKWACDQCKPLGASQDNPIPNGLGSFISKNFNLPSRHASAIAAILVSERYLDQCKNNGNAIMLKRSGPHQSDNNIPDYPYVSAIFNNR